jgi:hypothetical protein
MNLIANGKWSGMIQAATIMFTADGFQVQSRKCLLPQENIPNNLPMISLPKPLMDKLW